MSLTFSRQLWGNAVPGVIWFFCYEREREKERKE
jgi:hypothetical protein